MTETVDVAHRGGCLFVIFGRLYAGGNQMKTFTYLYRIGCFAFFALAPMFLFADEAVRDSKIRVLVAAIETADTRSEKMFNPIPMPKFKMPHSQSDLAGLTGDELRQAKARNAVAMEKTLHVQSLALLNEYARLCAHQHDVVKKCSNTEVGRNLLLARDWLAAALMEYEDVFSVIFRIDDSESQREKFFNGMNPVDVEEVVFFIKAVVNDPKKTSSTLQTAGGNSLTKNTIKQLVTFQLQNVKNEMVWSKNIEVEKSWGASSEVDVQGSNDANGELLREAFAKAAKELCGKYACDVTFSAKGPVGDKDFAKDDVSVTLDGNEIALDEPVRVTRIPHELVATLDGYTQKGSTKYTPAAGQKKQKKTIIMMKAKEDAEEKE